MDTNMRHWHGTFWEFKQSFHDTYIGRINNYDINVFGSGLFPTIIVIGNDNVGYAIIENTEGVNMDGVIAFVQERLKSIENILENN